MKDKNLKLLKKDPIILSGYVRYRSKCKTYYLMTNSRLLAKYLSSNKRKAYVKVSRDRNIFVINLDSSGNLFKPREKEVVTCISRHVLEESEKVTLKSKKTKFSFPVKIKLFPAEFNLDKYFFYPDQDAAKLANSLEEKGIDIPQRIMTPKAFNHDLVFNCKNKRVIVEITQIAPRESNRMDFKHQAVGGNIRAHIFDVYRECVNSKLLNKNDLIGFIILHKNWRNLKHITDLIPELKNLNSYIIFSEFKKDWSKNCSDEIMKRLN